MYLTISPSTNAPWFRAAVNRSIMVTVTETRKRGFPCTAGSMYQPRAIWAMCRRIPSRSASGVTVQMLRNWRKIASGSPAE